MMYLAMSDNGGWGLSAVSPRAAIAIAKRHSRDREARRMRVWAAYDDAYVSPDGKAYGLAGECAEYEYDERARTWNRVAVKVDA